MSRFDYVKYDEGAIEMQESAKSLCQKLETQINSIGYSLGPEEHKKVIAEKILALRKLEECYMWIGKAIRNDQIERNGSAELQEERNNS